MQQSLANDSILNHVEYLIDRQWKPLPGACLDALAAELDFVWRTIEAAIQDDDLIELLAQPLLDAVTWARRAISVSARFEALIGLGVAVHDVAAASHDLMATVVAQSGESGNVPDWLTDLALVAVVLDGMAVQIHQAGFVPEWVAQGPGQLAGAVAAAVLAHRHDFAGEAKRRWSRLSRSMRPDPALPSGLAGELKAAE